MRAFPFVRLRAFMALVLICSSLLVSSCGRVAPSYEPGTITVTSTPAGATIFIDGVDTGEITPFSFTELVANQYVVAVEMDGFFVDPADGYSVTLTNAAHVTKDFVLSNIPPTQLLVTSEPAGAAISLDGVDTGEITPATLTGLEAGDVAVSLVLDGQYVAPASYTATLVAQETTELPIGTFSFRNKKTVMMEGFSNVSCAGCPELAINVGALMHMEEYGLGEVLYVKFSMFWPLISDPHYQYNIVENRNRYDYYFADISSYFIPMIEIEGSVALGGAANSTPTALELAAFVDAALDEVPGFLIDITADFTNSTVPLATTITAMEDVDLTGHSLYIALVQDLVEYDEAPGNQGETEFHWVFRDRVDALPTLDAMTAGQVVTFNETVTRDEWDLNTLRVIAFVQNDATKEILQAGINNVSEPAPAYLFLDDNTTTRPTLEGNRP